MMDFYGRLPGVATFSLLFQRRGNRLQIYKNTNVLNFPNLAIPQFLSYFLILLKRIALSLSLHIFDDGYHNLKIRTFKIYACGNFSYLKNFFLGALT